MNTNNSKTSESNRFKLYFTDKLDFRGKKSNSFSKFVNILHTTKCKVRV